MKTEERISRIYDRATGEWFCVTEEEYAAYDCWRRKIRQREQYHRKCCCPREKWWICDGMCDDCEFRCGEEMLSLDAPAGDENLTLGDLLEAPGAGMEDVVADRDLVERLLQLLREMDPDADQIIALWQEDFRISDRKIAEKLGRAQKTFSRKMHSYREACREFLAK